MNFKIEISNVVNDEEWNNCLMRNKASTAYQIPQWSKIYQGAYGSIPVFLSVKNSDREIVGQLSAMIHNRLFWTNSNIILKTLGSKFHLRTTLSWYYGPIIHDKNHQEEIMSIILNGLDKIAKENNVTMIRGSSPPLLDYSTEISFHQHGYDIQNWATYVTDLRINTNDFYDSLNKKIRYDIRKSEKNELSFEVSDKELSSKEFSQLKWDANKKTGRKTKIDPIFGNLRWNNLNKNNYGKLFMARYRGKPIGGIYCIMFNKNVIQHSVVNSPKKELDAGTILTWNVLKWFIKNELSTFDMGGVNPLPINAKEKQIDFYKSKWGGKKLEYNWYTKIINKARVKFSSVLKNPKKLVRN